MIGIWAILIICFVLFFIQYERKNTSAREITLLASLVAIAVVGRIIFVAIPSAQPTSFIVITSAAVFGPQVGMLIGALSAFISNIFLGQGPWTPWQMLAWALMGGIAGLLFNKVGIKSKSIKIIFGFLSGILFGMIMDMWFISAYLQPFNKEAIIIGLSAGMIFNLIHGVSNVIFIALFSTRLEKILLRAKEKYGIFNILKKQH